MVSRYVSPRKTAVDKQSQPLSLAQNALTEFTKAKHSPWRAAAVARTTVASTFLVIRPPEEMRPIDASRAAPSASLQLQNLPSSGRPNHHCTLACQAAKRLAIISLTLFWPSIPSNYWCLDTWDLERFQNQCRLC